MVRGLSTRNHLRVAPERRALSPNRSPAAPEHRQVQGHRLRCGARRTRRGLGTNEPEPPRPPPPAAVAAASAKPSFGHHAAASQHVGRGRCQNPGGRLRATRDRARHKGHGTGGRCGRLARTQIVEAETAATVVPQEAREGLREASPDTLCATGSLSSRPTPPSRPSSGSDGALPPPAPSADPRAPTSSRRGSGTRPGPAPSRGRGWAGARLAVPAPRARARWRLPRGTAHGGRRGSPADASNLLRAAFRDKGALAFVKGTPFAVPQRA